MKSKRGRPPAAVDDKGVPEKTSEFPKLTISMRPKTKAMLDAIMALEKRSAWMVVEDALLEYRDRMRPADKAAVALIASRIPSTKTGR